MRKLLSVVGACLLGSAWGGERSEWNLEQVTGFYDDPANWSAGVPFGGSVETGETVMGYVPAGAGDIAIRIPQGVYRDSSSTLISGTPNGTTRTVLFDATGTSWEKYGTNVEFAVLKYGHDISGLYRSFGHVFRMEPGENGGHTHTAGEALFFRLTNGVLRVKTDGENGNEVHLDSGRWELPYAAADGHRSILYSGYSAPATLHLHEGSSLSAFNVSVHCANPGNGLYVAGGRHYFHNLIVACSGWGGYETPAVVYGDSVVTTKVLQVGCGQNNFPANGLLCLSNSASIVALGGVNIGYTRGSTGKLVMCDDSTLEYSNNSLVLGGTGGAYASGTLCMSNNAKIVTRSNIWVGYNTCSVGRISMADNARIEHKGGEFNLGGGNNGGTCVTSIVEMAGSSYIGQYAFYMSSGDGKGNWSSTTLRDQARLGISQYCILGNASNSPGGEIHLEDSSKFEVGHQLRLGNVTGTGGKAIITLSGNSTFQTGNILDLCGSTENPVEISMCDAATIKLATVTEKFTGGLRNVIFRANGGTIHMQPGWGSGLTIPDFSTAYIGEKGLTVAAYSATTIETVFSGEGTLTLSGNQMITLNAEKLTNTGGINVKSGTVVSLNDREWTLPRVGGGGSIGLGTLSTTIAAGEGTAAPTFLNLTLKDIVVDLGLAADAAHPQTGTEYVVAKFGANVTADVSTWTSVNVGRNGFLTFTLKDDGRVVARVGSNDGTMLIVR